MTASVLQLLLLAELAALLEVSIALLGLQNKHAAYATPCRLSELLGEKEGEGLWVDGVICRA